MSDLFENHIVGFPTRWLTVCIAVKDDTHISVECDASVEVGAR